jgi:hypothetical protein
MVGLIDIVPLVERVKIRDYPEIEVRGLNVTQLGLLVWRFPELRRLVEAPQQTRLEMLLAIGTTAIARIIATACPDQLTEEAASNLAISEQAEIITAMLKVMFPSDIRPFVELVRQATEWIVAPRAFAPNVAAMVTNSGTPPPSSEPTASAMQ